MKLLTFQIKSDQEQKQRVGALREDEQTVVDLQRSYFEKEQKECPYFVGMLEVLYHWEAAKKIIAEIMRFASGKSEYNLSRLTLLAPVPKPRTIRDTLCYEKHLIQSSKTALRNMGVDVDKMNPEEFKPGKAWYEIPGFYKGNVHSVVGHEAEISFPMGETFRDYELELGFYIGRKGKDIKREEALDFIAGFTIFNDWSSRMLQMKEMQLGLGPDTSKDFDTGNVMGPYLVTPDSFNHNKATMIVRVNGEERGRGNSGEAYHKLEDVVAYISKDVTLYPGDFIATGTVGNGAGAEINQPVEPGQVIELEIEGIGILRNKVVR
jgi:2-keto-4-pentenoate hydratase/2-oxohepta-3-ene-1,7-dioic acid hydratase in catechol pathway